MGAAACNQKKAPLVAKTKPRLNCSTRVCACKKKPIVYPEHQESRVFKDVFILFMVLDYLPFPDLIRVSQLSRGVYWLSGSQFLLYKFQALKRSPSSLQPKAPQKELNP